MDPQANVDEHYAEDIREKHTKSELAGEDSLVLEMLRRGDWTALMGMGTMRVTKSMLRLYCHGMIRVSERADLLFDERERMQAFLDSPLSRRYASNLAKVMTSDDKRFFEAAARIMGVGGGMPFVVRVTDGKRYMFDMASVSDDRYDAASRHYRGEAAGLYGGSFHGASDGDNGWNLFGVLAMGFLGGALLGSFDV